MLLMLQTGSKPHLDACEFNLHENFRADASDDAVLTARESVLLFPSYCIQTGPSLPKCRKEEVLRDLAQNTVLQ